VQDDLCRDCQACLLACSLAHEGTCSPNMARLSVVKDALRYEFHIHMCQHCEEPACEAACPAGAMAPDARGIRVMDKGVCTECGLCAEACPYGAIVYYEAENRYLKCDLCAGREAPLCVVVCPVQALTWQGE